MRVAHVTDIHVMRPPRLGQMFNKRLLGTANLYLGGRRSHFTNEVQEALVPAVHAQAPDALVCSGDLTAQATPEEFGAALALMGPLFETLPTAVIPGNHDAYAGDAVRAGLMEATFGIWMGEGPWPRVHTLGPGVSVIALDVCRPRLDSAGVIGAEQLDRLDEILAAPETKEGFVFAMLHYPLRGRRGEPYGPSTRALKGADRLEAVLMRHPGAVDAILHGHEHHGFRTALPLPNGSEIPILNPGASGYAWLPEKRRTAHFNVYTIEGDQLTVERFAFDGRAGAFAPETGGAYATGG